MCFLLVSPLIKIQLGAPVGTLIIVIIELSIAKVIRNFNFSCMLILGVNSKSLKGLVKLYNVHLMIFELIDVIRSLLGIF